MTSSLRLPYVLAGATFAAAGYFVDLEGYLRTAAWFELLAMVALLLSMTQEKTWPGGKRK